MSTRAFGLELDAATLTAIVAHAERDYPTEACGVVVGRPGAAELARVEPLKNAQDRYHQRDPARFTRTGRDAFRVDELERMRLLDRLEAEGLVERVLYHSHCEAGAYFSPEDRAMAVVDGVELLPDIVHVVVSVVAGRAAAAAAFRYHAGRACFDEVRIPLEAGASAAWPDLGERAMEGRAASRPIRPVGGRLVRRLISDPVEASRLEAAASARLEVGAEAHAELRRLALGLWSPATGVGPAARPRDWPVGPELPEARPAGLGPGDVVALVREGRVLGVLRLDSAAGLTGEVVVFASVLVDGDVDAADVRAELVRRGVVRARAHLDVAAAFLSTDRGDLVVPPVAHHPDPRARAVFAQNLGATEIGPHDPDADTWVRQVLDLVV